MAAILTVILFGVAIVAAALDLHRDDKCEYIGDVIERENGRFNCFDIPGLHTKYCHLQCYESFWHHSNDVVTGLFCGPYTGYKWSAKWPWEAANPKIGSLAKCESFRCRNESRPIPNGFLKCQYSADPFMNRDVTLRYKCETTCQPGYEPFIKNSYNCQRMFRQTGTETPREFEPDIYRSYNREAACLWNAKCQDFEGIKPENGKFKCINIPGLGARYCGLECDFDYRSSNHLTGVFCGRLTGFEWVAADWPSSKYGLQGIANCTKITNWVHFEMVDDKK